jgi:hypothetical protein
MARSLLEAQMMASRVANKRTRQKGLLAFAHPRTLLAPVRGRLDCSPEGDTRGSPGPTSRYDSSATHPVPRQAPTLADATLPTSSSRVSNDWHGCACDRNKPSDLMLVPRSGLGALCILRRHGPDAFESPNTGKSDVETPEMATKDSTGLRYSHVMPPNFSERL